VGVCRDENIMVKRNRQRKRFVCERADDS